MVQTSAKTNDFNETAYIMIAMTLEHNGADHISPHFLIAYSISSFQQLFTESRQGLLPNPDSNTLTLSAENITARTP